MQCRFCERILSQPRMPRGWKSCGPFVVCPACRRRRYRLRAITTRVVEPIGSTWPELEAALQEASGGAGVVLVHDQTLDEPDTRRYAVVCVPIAGRTWSLRLDSAHWSGGRRHNYDKILRGEAIVGEMLLYRGRTFSGHPAGDGLVCRMVAWLPRERHEEECLPDPRFREQEIALMDLDALRTGIRTNRISFPSQIPAFPGYGGLDLQCRLVQLYFVFGWTCASIAQRYRLTPQQVRRILNLWRRRAAKAGYIQRIPPAQPAITEMPAAGAVDVSDHCGFAEYPPQLWGDETASAPHGTR